MPILRSLLIVVSILLVFGLLVLAGCGPRGLKTADATVSAGGLWLAVVQSKTDVPPDHPASAESVATAKEMQPLVIAELNNRSIFACGFGNGCLRPFA